MGEIIQKIGTFVQDRESIINMTNNSRAVTRATCTIKSKDNLRDLFVRLRSVFFFLFFSTVHEGSPLQKLLHNASRD